MRVPLHIGIDDTDSVKAGCTTYIAASLVEKFKNEAFLDCPHLVRLNPNVPWKTRGNAALSLHLSVDEGSVRDIIEEATSTVEAMSQLGSPRTDPGIVFLVGDIPDEFTSFAHRTIQDIVSKKEALDLIRHFGAEAVGFRSGRGIIGSLAAIGETLTGDHTFEFIAYRTPSNRGTPRKVDAASVFKMDEAMAGLTFNSVDAGKRRVLLAPRGPDPVLLGLRGESLDAVKRAYKMLDIGEEVERWVIFRTNQGTDAHLQRFDRIADVKPYQPVVVEGSVVAEPHCIPGRHVIFTIADGSGQVDCAAYEPTGKFKNVVKSLIRSDRIEVFGGVRPSSKKRPKTVNLEKMRLLALAPKSKVQNPVCSVCGKHTESMGKGQGFRCKRCGLRMREAKKTYSMVERGVAEGLYIPPPRANRHLTKPLSRYGKEKASISLISRDFWGLSEP